MQIALRLALALAVFACVPATASAAVLYSQAISLEPGWNIVSTPRVLESHSFSTDENADNFDIYVLDAAQPSGWATMAQLGQTEFTPLYGYFINNKTDVTQTLTFNYMSDVAPNDRLFNRTFTATGWYSVGVANPTYAATAGTTTVDTNNPSSVLSALSGNYSTGVDLTDGAYSNNQDAVGSSGTWKATTASDVNSLRDLRETKGYAVFITATNSLYNGFQNNALPECADGVDNDADSNTDYPADTSCLSQFGNDEGLTPPIVASVAVANASSVPAQNVSLNVPGQPIGGFATTVSGEAVTIPQLSFYVATTSTGTGLITSATLVDQNGAVVAGPVDATYDAASNKQKIHFTDTVMFSTGVKTFTLKGTLPATFTNSGTIQASTNPVTDWIGALGQDTGLSISIEGTSIVSMSTMTVRGAALDITRGVNPAASTIVAGAQNVLLATINLDATQSGEDIRVSSLPTTFSNITGVSSCQIYNGSTALNTGSNVVNPTVTTAGATVFTFDNPLTIPKGTVVTLSIRCNLSSAATGNYTVGVPSESDGAYAATGVQSGTSLTEGTNLTATANAGATQAVGTSTLVASADPSAPSFTLVAGGTTGVNLNAIKFRATGEAMSLTEIGLTSAGTAGGSGAEEIVQATIWNGATQVGSVTFTSGAIATSTLTTPVTVPADTDVTLTIKVNVANVGTGQTASGGSAVDLEFSGARATGVNSGSTVYATGSSSGPGVRLEKSYPTVALQTLPSNGVADGRLIRFSVTANSNGNIGLEEFNFTIATSTITSVTGINLYAYTDSGFSTPVSAAASGQLQSSNGSAPTGTLVINTNNVTGGVLQVPAGQTYYFELRGSVAGVQTASSITTTLLGDANSGTTVGATSSLSTTNFVWSPNSTTTVTSSGGSNDFRNGAGVPGLPSSGLTQTRSL